jgi:hypothetical protein
MVIHPPMRGDGRIDDAWGTRVGKNLHRPKAAFGIQEMEAPQGLIMMILSNE